MRPVSAWAHMMSSAVSVAPKVGQDVNGKPDFGENVPYRAHIGKQSQLVRTATGQDVVSRRTVWLDTTAPILATARVTLSTADTGSTEAAAVNPPILSVERLSDQMGPHHVVLYLA